MSPSRKTRTPARVHEIQAAGLMRAATKRGEDADWTRPPEPDGIRTLTQDRPLSHREIEVLNLISEGKTNQEIATLLFLSSETIKSHVRNLLAKLGARSRAHAVSIAFHQGLLTTGSPDA